MSKKDIEAAQDALGIALVNVGVDAGVEALGTHSVRLVLSGAQAQDLADYLSTAATWLSERRDRS